MMEKFIPDEARIQSVQDNYKKVLSDVKETAIKAGRNPDDVRLMAVTKTVESFYINKVLDLGADLIGENRVQEFLGKKVYLETYVKTLKNWRDEEKYFLELGLKDDE